MNDLDDSDLKQELDRISKRIEGIMDKVDAIYPPQHASGDAEDPQATNPMEADADDISPPIPIRDRPDG
ncbi:MAG: hypothetical protein ACOWWM_01100 [Desulfobacterales bacterium]